MRMIEDGVEVREPRASRLGARIDRAIGVFSPERQWRRTYARSLTNQVLGVAGRGYIREHDDRLRGGWRPGAGSADADLLGDLPTLRQRARDLVRTTPDGEAIVDYLCRYVVGTGIVPQWTPALWELGLDPMNEADRNVIRLFKASAKATMRRWAPYADASLRFPFWELQKLLIRQLCENGDVFLLCRRMNLAEERKRGIVRPYSLAIQLIEADRVANPSGRTIEVLANGNELREGVEINSDGQAVAYHVLRRHPGDFVAGKPYGREADRIEARDPDTGHPNIIHVFLPVRVDASRGVPWLAAGHSRFKDVDDTVEAEIAATHAGACIAGFITSSNPVAAMQGDILRAQQTTTAAAKKRHSWLEPLEIKYLANGEQINFSSPNRPGGTFAPLVTFLRRMIGAASKAPYEMFAKDFSDVTFSAGRLSGLDGAHSATIIQDWLGRVACQPIANMMLEEAEARGDLELPSGVNKSNDLPAWFCAQWRGPGYRYVRPDQEVAAARSAIQGGLSSRQRECAMLGYDWEDEAEQLAIENARYDELNLQVDNNPQPVRQDIDPEDIRQALRLVRR